MAWRIHACVCNFPTWPPKRLYPANTLSAYKNAISLDIIKQFALLLPQQLYKQQVQQQQKQPPQSLGCNNKVNINRTTRRRHLFIEFTHIHTYNSRLIHPHKQAWRNSLAHFHFAVSCYPFPSYAPHAFFWHHALLNFSLVSFTLG